MHISYEEERDGICFWCCGLLGKKKTTYREAIRIAPSDVNHDLFNNSKWVPSSCSDEFCHDFTQWIKNFMARRKPAGAALRALVAREMWEEFRDLALTLGVLYLARKEMKLVKAHYRKSSRNAFRRNRRSTRRGFYPSETSSNFFRSASDCAHGNARDRRKIRIRREIPNADWWRFQRYATRGL